MTRYYVHYQSIMAQGPEKGKIIGMIAPIVAMSEREAINRVKNSREGSFGHYVNRLANEAVNK